MIFQNVDKPNENRNIAVTFVFKFDGRAIACTRTLMRWVEPTFSYIIIKKPENVTQKFLIEFVCLAAF